MAACLVVINGHVWRLLCVKCNRDKTYGVDVSDFNGFLHVDRRRRNARVRQSSVFIYAEIYGKLLPCFLQSVLQHCGNGGSVSGREILSLYCEP